MEDRKLSENESLGIITEMIKNARTNLRAKVNCNVFLVWGYVAIIVSFLVWYLKVNDVWQWSSLFWLLIPLTCIPATIYLHSKDRTKWTSYIDRSVFNITLLFAFCCITVGFSTLLVDFSVLFIEQLLISMMIVIMGVLIRAQIIAWGGVIGVLTSHILLFIPNETTQILVFAILFVFSVLIPGHLFKRTISSHV